MFKIRKSEYEAIENLATHVVDLNKHPVLENDSYVYHSTKVMYFKGMFILLHSRILASNPGGENKEYFEAYGEEIGNYAELHHLFEKLLQHSEIIDILKDKQDKIQKILSYEDEKED